MNPLGASFRTVCLMLEGWREPLQDAFGTALAPELAIPLHARPQDVLHPTIKRARAMALLFANQSKGYAGGLEATAPGRLNTDRDGRTAKRMLVEACYFIVAGRFGMAGTAKITTTQNSTTASDNNPKAAPPFVNFVKAMHAYACKAKESERGFERSLDDLAAIEAYLWGHPELYGFMGPHCDGGAEATASLGAKLFLNLVTDPSAKPIATSSS